MFKQINNEIFTSPEKCINECNKQIEFSSGIISYLEQYIKQLESIKVMAESTKKMQEINPLNIMMQMMNKKRDSE